MEASSLGAVNYTKGGMVTGRRITQQAILRILIAGFALVILLLICASVVGLRNLQGLEQTAAGLVTQQNLTARLINEIQLEQATMNTLSFRLSSDVEVNVTELLGELNQTEADFRRIMNAAEAAPEQHLWSELSDAVGAFARQARAVMDHKNRSREEVDTLLERHEQVLNRAERLVAASSARAVGLKTQIQTQSRKLANESLALLGSCLLLALACAFLTVRMTTESFRQMEWQASELSRVSWHLLEHQEVTARRFSHELHDELGQSLAAVRANLLALSPANWRERQQDCVALVDEAIGNVRELSQLLRPVILDDFGLDAGLRWLAEKFTMRTGIVAHYSTTLSVRLGEDAETHLFRIAQEALTNVARHSAAKEVWIELAETEERIRLRIRDNGKGLEHNGDSIGLGLVGMRARARHAGGEMSIDSGAGAGTCVEVWIPRTEVLHDARQEDAHPVSG